MFKSLNTNKIFADNIRKRRKQLKISQEKLGEISKLHRTYIGGIEQYLRNPSLLSMQKIANALQIDLWVLLSPDFDEIVNSDSALCSFKDGSYSFYPLDCENLEKFLCK